MKTGKYETGEDRAGGTVPALFMAGQLANILRITDRAVRKKATQENWPYESVPCAGGHRRLFRFVSLPHEIRKKVLVHYGQISEIVAEGIPAEFNESRIALCADRFDHAFEWQKERARARLAVLTGWRKYRETSRAPAQDRDHKFVLLFRSRLVPGLDEIVYQSIRQLSRSTLHSWNARFRDQGIAGLLPQHGVPMKGKCSIPEPQQACVQQLLLRFPRWRASRIHSSLVARFRESAAPRSTLAQYISRLRKEEPALWCYIQSPSEYKSNCQPAFGNASEQAQRFVHIVEIDSTLADVLCDDGKRYAVIGLIDVFSRKAKFLVSRTSNSWAIAGLIRATALDWGLPEIVVRDNGKDYDSIMVNSGLASLGIEVRANPPYTPEAKPHIERLFRTLSEGLFELLPGFCGHSVREAQNLRSRRSLSQYQKLPNAACTAGLSPQALQDAIDTWTETVYHQRIHRGLGVSPNAKAASVPTQPRRISDPRTLDILLAPCGKRKVTKKGIQFDRGLYVSSPLLDWIGRTITVRRDLWDAGRILCFSGQGEFLCEAMDPSLAGLTSRQYAEARTAAKKTVQARVKSLRTLAESVGDPLQEQLAYFRSLDPRIGDPAARAEGRGKPFVEKAQIEQEHPSSPDSPEIPNLPCRSEPPVTTILADEPDRDSQTASPLFLNARQRFDHLRERRRTTSLTEEEVQWLRDTIHEWLDYVETFRDQWPQTDRAWLDQVLTGQFDDPSEGGEIP